PVYDFGEVILGGDSCMTVNLNNIQQAGDFPADSAFMLGLATGGTFTITPRYLTAIHPGASQPLRICFQPSDTGFASLDSFYVIARCVPYALAVTGTGVTPLIYATDLDFGSVDSGQSICRQLTIRNPGKATLVITQQDLAGDPNFSIDASQKFPIVIPPRGSVHVQYCFHPQSWGSFSHRVTFFNQNIDKYKH